jgi:hypothetical protein
VLAQFAIITSSRRKIRRMRLASDDDLAAAVAHLAAGESALSGYRAEMLGHPTAGRSLRNYIALTEYPDMVASLTAEERFWSRYYWLARFARDWQAAEGYDAGLEQSVFKLLESGLENGGADPAALPDVDAAVERDTAPRPPR